MMGMKDDHCAICRVKLTETNKAKREDGTVMLDAVGRPWCVTCTEEHDSIDWDERAEQQYL
jgi:hypothetical protein